jgi:hypothetical protein
MYKAPAALSAAVEGILDDAVLRRVTQEMDLPLATVYICGGKQNLKLKAAAYNCAARHAPWLLLVDLDRDECAPKLRDAWLPSPNTGMCLRVAVREVESWLLADRERIAKFLGVPIGKVPREPDLLEDPKGTVVDLARHSRRRDVREDMLPRPKSGRSEGPAYASRLIEFAQDAWRPSVAEKHSDSLRRCQQAIRRVIAEYRQ